MHCTSPKNAQYNRESKTLYFGRENKSNMEPLLLPCKKCMACKLEQSRETALRAIHELKTQDPEKCFFLTLTYDNKHIGSNVLDYRDIQLFIKRLRKQQLGLWLNDHYPTFSKLQSNYKREILKKAPKIKYLVGGEYGEKNHRMHWHLLLYNVTLKDLVGIKTDDLGNQIFKSPTIEVLWGKNDTEQCPNEIGSITLESAGYVARYTVKKQGDEKTIGRRSTGFGREFLKRYMPDIFNYGKVTVGEHSTFTVPRYYQEYVKKHHPEVWNDYQSRVVLRRTKLAQERSNKERTEYAKNEFLRARNRGLEYKSQKTKLEQKKEILEQKFKRLKEHLKL